MERFLRRNVTPLLSKGRRKLAAWEFVRAVTRTVKMALTQSDKEGEDAGESGAGLGVQQNPQELVQAKDAVAIRPEIEGNSLNDDVWKRIGNVALVLLYSLILNAHLHYFLDILGDERDLQESELSLHAPPSLY